MKKKLLKTTLIGEKVSLEPLEKVHKTTLVGAASDGALWKLWMTSVPSSDTIDAYLKKALGDYEDGTALPFVVKLKTTNEIIGSTRYCNVEMAHKRLEIGYTWYAKSHQRTGVNTECKYLLLRHAFEQLQCIAVEFRTHWYNTASRNAIARLGAKQDGVLRNHRLDAEGNIRDTVVFSIIQEEWGTVKKHLEYQMQRYE
ncbi:MAG: GNAT family protein [Bacteroidota bacterium]